MFKLLIFIMFVSAGGIFYLILRRLRKIRLIPKKELLDKLQTSNSVFFNINQYIIVPVINFYRISVLPKIYKESEKIISHFRINILKIEGRLLRLTNYIRGKRKIHTNNNHSPYWKNIKDATNCNK